MIPSDLLGTALGALLANEELAEPLLRVLQRRHRLGYAVMDALEATQQECRRTIVRVMDARWPRRFRANETEQMAKLICANGFLSSPELPCLTDACEQLLERNGDWLQFRSRQVQQYASWASQLDPMLLGAWHLAGWLRASPRPRPHDAVRVLECQLPMLSSPAGLNEAFADNHVHFGGVAGDDLVLARLLLDPAMRAEPTDLTTRLRPLRRNLKDWLRGCAHVKDGDRCIQAERASSPAQILLGGDFTAEVIDWASLEERYSRERELNGRFLLFRLGRAQQRRQLARAWLYLLVLLAYRYRDPGAEIKERAFILAWWNRAMALRRDLMVDAQGIRHFVSRSYGSPLRRQARQDHAADDRDAARRLLLGPKDRAEIKISPPDFKAKKVYSFARDALLNAHPGLATWMRRTDLITDGSMVDAPRPNLDQELDRWHFCAHFLRSDPKLDHCDKHPEWARAALRKRQKIWREAIQLDHELQKVAGWRPPGWLQGLAGRGQALRPMHWLRGLDVAGDESAWQIEIFAPALRWLRRGFLPRMDGEPAGRGFHLSIHAGEDYSHPLSGMRHVDETLRFCEMRAGDRIGHGLALGISPAAWLERHGQVLLPVAEHLDNLVWAWHVATELSATLPLAAQVLPRLERRIASFWPHVPWAKQGLCASHAQSANAADALHRAWLLRRNCAWELSQPALVDMGWPSTRYPVAVPDHARLSQRSGAIGGSSDADLALFRARALAQDWSGEAGATRPLRVMVHAHLGDPDRQEALERKAADSGLLHDHDSAAELEFMEALQDHMLTRIAKLGVWIETNPSSNLYISRMQRMSEHPIFRWSPPNMTEARPLGRWNRFGLRCGAVNVLVNTDDPGIMPTTLRMEFELLREAAVDLGYAPHDVDLWLQRLRGAGLDQFERNHLPVCVRRPWEGSSCAL